VRDTRRVNGPLVGVAELAARLDDGHTRAADVRWYLTRPGAGCAAYDAGHIPGAVFVDLEDDLSDATGFGAPGRHPLPSPAAFCDRLARLGVSSDDFIVAYDDAGGINAARLWWMLDNLGHRGGVAVLDGGIGAWQSAGLPLSTTAVNLPARRLVLAAEWRGVIDRSELAQRLGQVSLLDARSAERYRGDFEPIDPLAGHIPTAVSAPTARNLADDGHMLAREELRRRYGELAVADRPVVVACGSGTTACHNALAMRLAGLPDPILYAGSFSDWSRSAMPVATGPEPGLPSAEVASR
jgi:thiosulfate/3-mercaptopyruvate sulfurtransferase